MQLFFEIKIPVNAVFTRKYKKQAMGIEDCNRPQNRIERRLRGIVFSMVRFWVRFHFAFAILKISL